MTTEYPGRRRAPLCAAGPIAGIAAALCLFAGAALAVETAPRAVRELVPNGPGGTIELSPPATAEETVSSLTLEKGKSVIVRTAYGVTRVSVGDPKIADVIVLHTQEIQIVAKETGSTNVVLWGGGGGIQAAIDLHVGTRLLVDRERDPPRDRGGRRARRHRGERGRAHGLGSRRRLGRARAQRGARALPRQEGRRDRQPAHGRRQSAGDDRGDRLGDQPHKSRGIATNFAAQDHAATASMFEFINRDRRADPADRSIRRRARSGDRVRRLDQFPRHRVPDRNRRLRALRASRSTRTASARSWPRRRSSRARARRRRFLSGGEVPYLSRVELRRRDVEFKPVRRRRLVHADRAQRRPHPSRRRPPR